MEIYLNPGRLLSLSSLHYYLSPQLANLADLFASGQNPSIIWDLRSVLPRKQSLTALTALTSICKRVSDFAGRPAFVLHRLDPAVLRFWGEIGFIRITQDTRSLQWEPNYISAFSDLYPESSTTIMQISGEDTPPNSDKPYHYTWKDISRSRYSSLFVSRTYSMFERSGVSPNTSHAIAISASELALNCITHGHADAFVSFQNSRRGVSVCVCDAGRGFRHTVRKKNLTEPPPNSFDDLDAIFTGCFINRTGAGLRGTIDSVINNFGHVLISSGKGEILWTGDNWLPLRNTTARISNNSNYRHLAIRESLGPPHQGSITVAQRELGYHHLHEYRLLGSRVHFEIPHQSGA